MIEEGGQISDRTYMDYLSTKKDNFLHLSHSKGEKNGEDKYRPGSGFWFLGFAG